MYIYYKFYEKKEVIYKIKDDLGCLETKLPNIASSVFERMENKQEEGRGKKKRTNFFTK